MRRPSIDTGIKSFENDQLSQNGMLDVASFEAEPAVKPGSSTIGNGLNVLTKLPISLEGITSKGTKKSDEPSDSHKTDYGAWAVEAEQSLYASSNRVTEDDMEDKLDQQARAAGFKYTPENCMQAVFILLDEPDSGLFANIIGKCVMSMIIVSSVCLIAETHPPLGPCADPAKAAMWGYADEHRCCEDWGTTVEEATSVVNSFHSIEAVVILTFTAEYALRVLFCTYRPRRNRSFWAYVIRPLNVVDLISVAPWWFEMAFGGNTGLAVVRLARLARVFRLLKAGTFLKELQLFVWGYYRAREGLLLLIFLLFMYLACFGSMLYLVEYNPQSEACFTEAGFPECWGFDDKLGKDTVKWDTIIEFGDGCDHCKGNLWNCTFASETGASLVRQVDRLGDCIGDNETAGEVFPCDPSQPHYADSDCRTCSDVEWPGKEPMRCHIRPFTSIPITTYFIMATMTTVGYGEHYPGSTIGKIVCGFCMISGIMVLALPMVIIGQAFEETIREEKKMSLERERRLKIMVLDREQRARRQIEAGEGSITEKAKRNREELEVQLTDDIVRLDGEKAEREKYDIDTIRFILINLFEHLGDLTSDDRFTGAAELLAKDADEF